MDARNKSGHDQQNHPSALLPHDGEVRVACVSKHDARRPPAYDRPMSAPRTQTSGEDDRPSRDYRVGLPAREAAVSLLDAVLANGQPLDTAFAGGARNGLLASLAERDRALARAIAATALRRLGQIEAVLTAFLERPLPKGARRLEHILHAGLAQILFMEIPVHAVVNLAVHQAQANAQTRRFGKLVNALLRRAASEGAALVAGQDAARMNTPGWLWRRWSTHYGEATARAIAQAHLGEAALDLTVKSDPALWAERLGGVVLVTGSVRLRPKGRIEALAGFGEGAWWVQDAAAALPARLLGDVAGKRIADLCAAPGGKTAQLAAMGARVTAVDISENRLGRLKQNLARLGLEALCVAADAAAWRPEERFDAVLLDAPCLATGTIRRHPDIPRLKREADLAALTALQARLLDNAAALVEPGGLLVYCTCSLEPEEGEERIGRTLETTPGLRLEPVVPEQVAGEAGWLTDAGYLRTLPHYLAGPGAGLSGMDGFFAARLRVA